MSRLEPYKMYLGLLGGLLSRRDAALQTMNPPIAEKDVSGPAANCQTIIITRVCLFRRVPGLMTTILWEGNVGWGSRMGPGTHPHPGIDPLLYSTIVGSRKSKVWIAQQLSFRGKKEAPAWDEPLARAPRRWLLQAPSPLVQRATACM